MSKAKTYPIKANPALSDTLVGNNTINSVGQPIGETMLFQLTDVLALFLSGLTPIEGGTLKITELTIATLDTDIATTVNAYTPAYEVAQYEVLCFNVAGQIFMFKEQDVTIGFGEDPVTNNDFIEFPISVGPTGATGAAGAAGTPGSTLRNGTGAPSNGLGVNGDYYLNDANGDLYLKSGGTYAIVFNIKGAAGTNGTNGTNGADGVSLVESSDTIDVTGDGSVGDPFVPSIAVNCGWIIGDTRELVKDSTWLNANFSITGLGTGAEVIDWAITNGNNGTPNDNGKVVIAYGTDYLTLGATGGSKDAVVVAHTHGVTLPTNVASAPGSGGIELPGDDNSTLAIETDSEGVSGTNANMQPYVVRLRIMKIA